MPEISRYLGITIYMRDRDHPPPHFHVRYAGHSAIIDIETMQILEGRLPTRVYGWSLSGACALAPCCVTIGDGPARASPYSRFRLWSDEMLRDVVEVRPLEGYRVFLRFDDGVQGEIDLEPLLAPFDGVFEPLTELPRLREVFVDDGGTIAWPNGADLAPEILYSVLSGHPLAQR